MRKIIVLFFVLLLCFSDGAFASSHCTGTTNCKITYNSVEYYVDPHGIIYSDQALNTPLGNYQSAILDAIQTSSDYTEALNVLNPVAAPVGSSSGGGGVGSPRPATELTAEQVLVKDIQREVDAGTTTFSQQYDYRIASARQATAIAQRERQTAYKKKFSDAVVGTTIIVEKTRYILTVGGAGGVPSWKTDDGKAVLRRDAQVTTSKGIAQFDGSTWKYIIGDKEEVPPEEISAALSLQSQKEKDALAAAKEFETEADWIEWRGSWYEGMPAYNIFAKGEYIVGDIVSGVSRIGRYQAFSNFLADHGLFESWVDQANADWMRQWQDVEGFAVEAICKEDSLKRSKLPGTTTQMVQTVSSYQFVGSIQAEVSPRKVPILCTKEIKDEQEQFTCPADLICINNEFCATSQDATIPTSGYFYKLSWGVTAPTDEKSTPFIDEEGNAVKLNLRLEDENGATVFFYKRANQQNENTIKLRNGDHDGNTHAFYSPTRYVEACIIFSSGYQVKDLSGEPVKQICATFKSTERGKVEFENSNRQPSITTSSGEVSVNTNI